MLSEQPKKHYTQNDYNFNLKVIMYLVAIEVFILVCISFVKIYVDKKHSLTNRMRDEINILEKIFLDDIDYSSYVLMQMANLIKHTNYHSDKDSFKIDNILSHYNLNINDKNFFGWHGFSWLDSNQIVRNTNYESTINIGANLNYLTNVRLSKIEPGQVFYSLNPSSNNYLTGFIDFAIGINNDEGNFIGTLLLQMETSSLLEDLEIYRRNNFTDFAVIDNRLNIIASYPINATRIGINGKIIKSEQLLRDIQQINFFSDNPKEFSYINMINGNNYLAKKIRNKPYIMLVSIEPEYIKATLTQKIALKFIEIAILASFFLVLVMLIYKRETWLRAKAEKASQLATKAMVAKSDFLSYTAHEIRSPLGFILTGSEIMDKKLFGDMPDQYKDYVSGIYHNARLILDFINDILDERHVASGNFKLEETICNLNKIINKAVITNKTRFHSRKIEIEKNIQENLPLIFGDERKILQALNNLISNSYKYSLDNTVITVKAKLVANKVKLIVSDQGIGMTEDEIEIALTKYGTVHNDRSGNFIESSGLGLPIVIMLTKAHQATFEIKSKVGIGTTVTITFPERRLIKQFSNNLINNT